MKNTEVQNIKRLLVNTFNGSAWHGPSVMKVLEEINSKVAFEKNPNIHSVAELVEHMIIWRRFATERLKGNHSYEVVESENWKTFLQNDDTAWLELKSRLVLSQEYLLAEIEKTNDSKLSELVDEKAFDYYTLLHGVIQHDIYHAGQISLLKKR